MGVKFSDYKKRKEEILALLTEDIRPLDETTKSQRLKAAREDYFYFFKTYLPHYAEQNFADFHREMIAMLEERKRVPTPICIAAPRGFAKSTHISFGYVLWSILFRKRNFIVIVSESDDLAADLVEFIKIELKFNQRILQDFGNLLTEEGEASDFVANGVRVFARGRKQMVRGFRFRQHRPDLIILDDIEKDESAESPAVVLKTLKVITDGIYPSLAPFGNLFIIGTIIRKRSVLGTILLHNEEPYSGWKRKIYRAMEIKNGKEVSLWEERFSHAALKEIKEKIGTLAFNREYQNHPQDDEVAVFKEEWFREYEPSEIDFTRLKKSTFIDASATNSKKSDYKAIITVGLDTENMVYYVLNAWIKRASIDAMLQATYSIHQEFLPSVVGVEANGFQSLLEREYDILAKEKGHYLPLKLITHTTAKDARIERISPLVERGKLLFNRRDSDQKLLIEQMIYFPSSVVNDDGPDSLEGAISLLESITVEDNFTPVRRRKTNEILRGYNRNRLTYW